MLFLVRLVPWSFLFPMFTITWLLIQLFERVEDNFCHYRTNSFRVTFHLVIVPGTLASNRIANGLGHIGRVQHAGQFTYQILRAACGRQKRNNKFNYPLNKVLDYFGNKIHVRTKTRELTIIAIIVTLMFYAKFELFMSTFPEITYLYYPG